MSKSSRNALFGVLDYAAFPAGMLIASPVMLHHLGAEQFGVWVMANAFVNLGGVVASGFGDANIYHVASLRSSNAGAQMVEAVRSICSLHLLLGLALGAVGWGAAHIFGSHVALGKHDVEEVVTRALRWASLMMPCRALETVCVSTLRAFQDYGKAVQVSSVSRLTSISLCAILSVRGWDAGRLQACAAMVAFIALGLQWKQMLVKLGVDSIRPIWSYHAFQPLLRFGLFSWAIAAAGVISTQADRLIVGASIGAATLASYALCVQISQPVYGVTAAALHYLFPKITDECRQGDRRATLATLGAAVARASVFAVLYCGAIYLFGEKLLAIWIRDPLVLPSSGLLSAIALSFALLAMSVPAYYALLALGDVRNVALIQGADGAAMLLLMLRVATHPSLHALAFVRFVYSFGTLLLYVPLFLRLRELKPAAELVQQRPAFSEEL